MAKIPEYSSGVRLDQAPNLGRKDESLAGAPGRMTAKVGETMVDVADQLQKARDFSETMAAKNATAQQIQDLKFKAANDPDPYSNAYEAELQKILANAGSNITSPRARDAYAFEAQNDVALANYDIRNTYRTKQIDFGKAGLYDTVKNAERDYTATDNPTQQAIILDSTRRTIEQGVAAGFITREEGAKRIQTLANDMDMKKASQVIFNDPARGLEMVKQGNFQHLTEEQKLTLQGKANSRLAKLKQDAKDRVEQEQLANSQKFFQQYMASEKDPSIAPPTLDQIEEARAAGAAQMPGGIDAESYTALKVMLTEPKAENVPQERKAELLRNLADKFADLNPQKGLFGGMKVTPQKTTFEKVVAYRKALLEANQVKGLISPTQFQNRMILTEKVYDKGINEYVSDHSKNLFALWDGLTKWVEDNKAQGVFNVDEAKSLFFSEIVDRMAENDITQDQIPVIGKELVKKYIINKMPELAGLDDIPNNGITAAGGFKKLYSGQTALQPDFKTSAKPPAQKVFKPGDTKQKGDVTYYRWSNGEWRTQPEQTKS